MNKCVYILVLFLLVSCREDELIVLSEYETLSNPNAIPSGMYVLNEGNMGGNKASIDFVDFRNFHYIRNLYLERNQKVIKELGDIGNDIQIYGGKLYAVINGSNKVEVMDAQTCKRIARIDIPNCRYIRFAQGNAYVSSYVGLGATDPDAQLGAVYRIDTASLQITGEVTVGYQPNELEVLDGCLYVANSGGYSAASEKTDYDSTVSVVEMNELKQIRKIPVAINLHRIRKDSRGKLWVSSLGDYAKIPSRLFVIEKNDNSNEMVVTDTLNVPCSDMCIAGDSLYFCSVEWDMSSNSSVVSYGIINTLTKELVTIHFITDGTEQDIVYPYGIKVNPVNGDIYIADAMDFVTPGKLHCYDNNGKLKWLVRTGNIPAHLCFLN
jgi:DNA-binding beta-propeller fold protein YncE